MSNPYFQFKQFIVHHGNCAMKVSTDSVLLGSWANCTQATSILDIGAGSGILSLMMAQRSEASILGLEIDTKASRQASSNVAQSAWAERIKIENISFQEFSKTNNSKFDFIISNPPYFVNSLESKNQQRTTARHTSSLTFQELWQNIEQVCENKVVVAVIIPSSSEKEFKIQASYFNFFLCRKATVQSSPKKAAHLVMLEFQKQKNNLLISENIEIRDSTNKYSDRYTELTRDFYLEKMFV